MLEDVEGPGRLIDKEKIREMRTETVKRCVIKEKTNWE